MTDVLVFGSGLIGTSIGLALRDAEGFRVLVHDLDPAAQELAVARGAGEGWDGGSRVDILVAAVPPANIPGVLKEVQALCLAKTYTHVASVQSQVQREVEALGCELSSLVGSHPLAGRESSGPGAASSDLFVGRPWALCPSAASRPFAVDQVRGLVLACGATPLVVGAQAHDESVALLSHLPQVVSSALAALLDPPVRTELSGGGLADTTRLAASDPGLWTDILSANAAHVAPAVRALVTLLEDLAADLERLAPHEQVNGAQAAKARADALTGVTSLLEHGNRGRALVPVKRGVRDEAFARVAVEMDDRPGRLAALLGAAGDAGVNVEDVRVDHIPGRPRGVIELLVATEAARSLEAVLTAEGWLVRPTQ